jgi:signal peptidase I
VTALLVSLLGVSAALAAVAVWVRRQLVTVTVNGDSMLPVLLPGDRVLVRRTRVNRLARDDIVVFARPLTAERTWMIKRVVAAPGDPVPRQDVPSFWSDTIARIPARHFVVLGDNPSDSYDSRSFGYLHADGLLGVVVGRLGGPAVMGG